MVNVGYPERSISPTLKESSMPGGLGEDTDNAEDVGEYDSDGVSGVVGGAIYDMLGFEGGSTGLGGEGYRCP
jgi:hypothetical protein